MSNDFIIALHITALGMGLVFAAILVLWGMMNLLTRLTSDKEPEVDSADSSKTASTGEDDLRARAAAVAVALALAQQQTSGAYSLVEPPTAIVSAWQLGMRTRQMYQKGSSMRRRARQDDK
jgi:Na+-transporting methylmalonyl-CoA/oxaloacetate decarboxylase gamma subunit